MALTLRFIWRNDTTDSVLRRSFLLSLVFYIYFIAYTGASMHDVCFHLGRKQHCLVMKFSTLYADVHWR